MKVICVNTDRDINYFLDSFKILREFWSTKETLNHFRKHLRTENEKRIIIIDYDKTPELKGIKPPQNWYIIGLTINSELKQEHEYSLIHKFSSTENILNVIQEITDETCYRQIGNFPLFLGITRFEVDTPNGVIDLVPREWRILNYLNKNQGRKVSSTELSYHVFEAGEENEVNTIKMTQVYLARLRKQFLLAVNSPVISYGARDHGISILDFHPSDFEYIINRYNNKSFIVVDEATKELTLEFYKKLAQIVAEKSLYELQHSEKLTSKHRRYNFLKNNLILKENFSLSKVMLLLKKIRFPKIKRGMQYASTEPIKELSYQ